MNYELDTIAELYLAEDRAGRSTYMTFRKSLLETKVGGSVKRNVSRWNVVLRAILSQRLIFPVRSGARQVPRMAPPQGTAEGLIPKGLSRLPLCVVFP